MDELKGLREERMKLNPNKRLDHQQEKRQMDGVGEPRKKRMGFIPDKRLDHEDELSKIREPARPTQLAMEDVVWRQWKKGARKKIAKIATTKGKAWQSHVLPPVDVDKNRRLKVREGEPRTRELAQFLIDAARMYEAISMFQDRSVVKEGLFADPPLHPRRTLDPLHHRSRRVEAGTLHKFEPQYSKGKKKSKDDGEWKWSGHWRFEDDGVCSQCLEDIRRVPKAVMVDQLWMWILDEHTILTCFPQRIGVGRKDPSGVHSSIRAQIADQSSPANHVRSVFDLALIILRQCVDNLWDTTATPDGRPQVLDNISRSIGAVVSCLLSSPSLSKAGASSIRSAWPQS